MNSGLGKGPVHVGGIYFAETFHGDPRPLLDRQRMLGRLDLDEGPYPRRADVDVRLEILRAGVDKKLGREPPEIGTEFRSVRLIERWNKLVEALAAQRYPSAPDVRFRSPQNRDFDTPANKEEFIVDDAGFGGQPAAIPQLGPGIE
jgi:hypothetical protein